MISSVSDFHFELRTAPASELGLPSVCRRRLHRSASALVSWVGHGPVLHSPTHNQKLVCLGHECIGLLGEKLDPLTRGAGENIKNKIIK